ncbi:four helix bundle protein [Planctomicrobium piriforme]|uniref:Four helix bundle protein n=1 Tax=Planctomicrobium piriforme TaxID=1576369 RepID=A0A1I3DH78_9PLAN|nr:four helix bundle protein [Planctomicrobium piriforme]SFH85939.1 four helix bundle protein [Planctomicrobium piriforme]
MAAKFRFYDLDVWRKAIDYAELVYQVTATFPDGERFGLVSQLRRAAVSISSNIAEGSSRSSDVDFARFVEIAYGSTLETVSQICIALKLRYINREDFDKLTQLADDVSRMLSGLRKSLIRK